MPITPTNKPPYYGEPTTNPKTINIIFELNQETTETPTKNIITNNTNNTLTITRQSVGNYKATSENIFTDNKTIVNNSRTGNPQTLYSKTTIGDYYLQAYRTAINEITIQTRKTSDFSAVDISEIESPIVISIQVYN